MDLGRQGGRQQGQKHQRQAMRLPHPGAQPHIHLHHHDSWILRASHTPGTVLTNPPQCK